MSNGIIQTLGLQTFWKPGVFLSQVYHMSPKNKRLKIDEIKGKKYNKAIRDGRIHNR